jgi:hypothetical protein
LRGPLVSKEEESTGRGGLRVMGTLDTKIQRREGGIEGMALKEEEEVVVVEERW